MNVEGLGGGFQRSSHRDPFLEEGWPAGRLVGQARRLQRTMRALAVGERWTAATLMRVVLACPKSAEWSRSWPRFEAHERGPCPFLSLHFSPGASRKLERLSGIGKARRRPVGDDSRYGWNLRIGRAACRFENESTRSSVQRRTHYFGVTFSSVARITRGEDWSVFNAINDAYGEELGRGTWTRRYEGEFSCPRATERSLDTERDTKKRVGDYGPCIHRVDGHSYHRRDLMRASLAWHLPASTPMGRVSHVGNVTNPSNGRPGSPRISKVSYLLAIHPSDEYWRRKPAGMMGRIEAVDEETRPADPPPKGLEYGIKTARPEFARSLF
ncbi:hypothetical protein KM043_000721 [Ampulex compressa]|nr:hypothetical protein KM043_000721 [Ampulex compressa]